jgi:hypothetical protein
MTAPKRIQRRRTAGWRMPEGVVYVGRDSAERWGNPFRVDDEVSIVAGPAGGGSDAFGCAMPITPQLAVDLFRAWLLCRPVAVAAVRELLAGHDLACWCPLGQPCHADVLLEVANGAGRG